MPIETLNLTERHIEILNAARFFTRARRYHVGMALTFHRSIEVEPYSGIFAGPCCPATGNAGPNHGLCAIGSFSQSESLLPEGCVIGRYSTVGSGLTVVDGPLQNGRISNHAFVRDPAAMLVAAAAEDRGKPWTALGDQEQPAFPVVGNDVRIGDGVALAMNVRVGDGAVIESRSVVLEDVLPYAVVAGNPATVTRYRYPPALVARLLDLQWWGHHFLDFSGLNFEDTEAFIDGLTEHRRAGRITAYKPEPLRLPEALIAAGRGVATTAPAGAAESGDVKSAVVTPGGRPSLGRVHFVLARKTVNLRMVEHEFADDIGQQLPDWPQTRTETIGRGAVNVTFYIHRRAHLMMSHGVADKNYLLRTERGEMAVNKFSDIAVPGPWLKRKMVAHPDVRLAEDSIHVVGWPRLDRLLAAQRPRRPGDRTRVLWAPTHNSTKGGATMSSYPGLLDHLPLLEREFELETSLHPANRQGGKPTFEALLDADVVVSDGGTLVYEALALGKPVIFPDWLIRDSIVNTYTGSAEAEFFNQSYGLHADGPDALMALLRAPPPIDDRTKTFLDDYLSPETYGRSSMLLAEVVRDISVRSDVRIGRRPPRTPDPLEE